MSKVLAWRVKEDSWGGCSGDYANTAGLYRPHLDRVRRAGPRRGMAASKQLVIAHREYLAYAMRESTKIDATDHPRYAERMPKFDAEGGVVRQRHEAAVAALRLVAASQETEAAMVGLVSGVRQGFINAARSARGLPPIKREFGSQVIEPALVTQDALGSGDA